MRRTHRLRQGHRDEYMDLLTGALAYIQAKLGSGKTCWGAGIDTNIELASIKAVLSAVNRAILGSERPRAFS